MKLIRIWRFTFWIRLTDDDAWGMQAGIEYRRRPAHMPGAIGFKEWTISIGYNTCEDNNETKIVWPKS